MTASRTRRASQFFRPWTTAVVTALLYSLMFIAINDGDPFALFEIGTQFSEGIAEEAGGTEGYDGQFVYYIARDPSTAAQFLDVPAYRYQRMLLPFAGRAVALGQHDLLPWSILLVNLIALGGGTAILEHILVIKGVSRWYALGYALSIGVWGTVRLSLPETLAYSLVLGGILMAMRNQWLLSAVIFALAALTKETTLLFVGGYAIYMIVSVLQARRQENTALQDQKDKILRLIIFVTVAVIPFLIWQLVLLNRLGAVGVGSGGAKATGFEIIPMMGVIRILLVGGPVVFLIFLALLAPFVLYPTYWALRQCWIDLKTGKYDAVVFLLLVNGLIMLFVPFSTYREPLGILRFIVGLQVAVIVYAAERNYRRTLLNSTIWMWTTLFLIGSDFGGEPT